MVTLASPEALLWLVLPGVAAVLAIYRNRRRTLQQRRLASPGVWDRVMGGTPSTGLIRMLAWCAAGVMVVLALARPQWGELPAEESVRTRDLVVAVDVSDSMLCPDIQPSRLARGLEVLQQVLPALEGNRIAVVVFAGEAYPLVPLTTDLSAVSVFLQGVHPGMVGRPGSNLETAASAALRLLPDEGEGRVLILITDGENLQGNVAGAARALKDASVGVISVMAGTEAGGPIPVPSKDGSVQYKRDSGGQPVVTRAQPGVLREVADAVGGTVLQLTDNDVGHNMVLAVDELQTREVEENRTVQRVERFPIFLSLAALLSVAGFALNPWRRLTVAIVLALLWLPGPVAAQQVPGAVVDSPPADDAQPVEELLPEAPWWQRFVPGGSRRLARSGASNFESGDLETAVRDFAAAAALDPDEPERLYDLGTALAAAGQLQTADPLLARAHETGVAGAAYNGGTASLTQGQAQRAVQLLREALLSDPDDPDVKRNYELALKLLEEQQNEQQDQQQNEDQDEQQQDQQPEEQQGQPTPTPTPSPGQGQAPPTPTPQNEPLYSALDRAEAEAREAMQSPTPAQSSVEKDW